MSDNSSKLERALVLIKQRGLDGLIVYSNGTCSMLRPTYFHYFAELKPLGPNYAVVVSKSGDAVLLVEPEWDVTRASERSWVSDVRGTSDFIRDLLKIMKDFGMTTAVGVSASREMTEDVYVSISKKAKIEPADDIIEELTRKKTQKEIDNLRKVAMIADIGSRAFEEYSRVGIREYEMSAEIEYAMRKAGADDNFILVSSGKHNYAMHSPSDKRLETGDIVLGEITPICEGQFLQLCRTLVLGKPNPVIVEKYDMLCRSLKEALAPIKPSVPASAISIAMNKVISDAGYAKYCAPPYMRARGHGIGVGTLAPGGTIDNECKEIIEEQQAIIVHPNQYLPETGYLACGETVLVTDIGFELLTKTKTILYSTEEV